MPGEAGVLSEVLDDLDDLADVLVGRKLERPDRHLLSYGEKHAFCCVCFGAEGRFRLV